MANQPLVGAAPFSINDVPVITVTKMSFKRSRPITIKKGAFGSIGAAKGQPTITGTITLAVPKTGLEIDLQAWFNSEDGYSCGFPKGTERWKAYGVYINEDDFNSDYEPGNTEQTLNLVAADMDRVQ